MPAHSDTELRRIFDLVADAPPDRREAVLRDACRGDADLIARVRAILAASEDERFLAEPEFAARPEPVLASKPDEPLGSVGPFTIVRRLGEGGFGVVYLAQQSSPVKRDVALKIVKAGMDTAHVLARFEQERQVLALLDHPNIARMFDAGATDTGRPYFVMEYVPGESLIAYCDQQRLSIARRLELFTQVCDAVHHAHQKGLIHRDLKPSNVLVATRDGQPHVKVIDFGIAKATAGKLTDRTIHTEHRQLIGTPEYMSPEQAEGSLDVDTRSDIYSLGVILYELLTGTTPFDVTSLRSATFVEMQRIIREVDPPKPSTRVKQSVDTSAELTSRRNVEPRRLDTILRGELDWIVMKAIEKDRSRRYDSPNALATDIQLYLAGEAVTAAPPSRTYLMRKFVRRNKGPVSTVVAVGVALLAGAIAFAWQANVAWRERDRAVKAEAETARQADAARRERDRAVQAEAETARRADELQKVSDFQSEMLAKIEPSDAGFWLSADVRSRLDTALAKSGASAEERGRQLAAFSDAWSRINATDAALALIKSTLFSPALDAIDRKFADQPKLNATLRAAIATRYLDLGLYEDALKVFDQALELRRRALGPEHPDTRAILVAKAKVLIGLGRTAEAEALMRPLIASPHDDASADDPLALRAIEMLGESELQRNQWTEAESLFRRSLAGRRKALGEDDADTLQSMGNLAMALRGQARYAEAEKLAREVLERRLRIYGEGNPYTNSAYNNVAVILLDEGRAPEALECFQKAAEGHRRALGETHRDTLLARNNLASTLGRLGRREEALVIQRDLFAQTRKAFGPDHPDALLMLTNLASSLIESGKLDEAEPLCRESLERQARVYGARSAQAATANNVMAFLMRRQNRDADAEPFLRASLDIATTAWGVDHPERMVVLNNMAALKRKLGDLAGSEAMYREAIERIRRAIGPDYPQLRVAIQGLADTLIAEKRDADAEVVLAGAEETFRRAAAKDDQGDLRTMLIILARTRASQRKFALAEANYKEAYDRFIAARGPTSKGAQASATELANLYATWHEVDPKAGHDAQAAEWRSRVKPPTSNPSTAPVAASRTSPSSQPR
jgi:non-specific serine/threonine protein kinase/serine/threonine-protein kinase